MMSSASPEDNPLLKSSSSSRSGSNRRASRRWITVEPLIILIAAAFSPMNGLIVTQYIEYRLALERNFTLQKDDSANGTCNDQNTSTNPDFEIQQEIAADTAFWVMITAVVTYFPALFIAPFYGALGDRLGRKVHLLIPVVAAVTYTAFQLIVVYESLPIYVFACASIINGLGGGYCFFMAGMHAYISDITSSGKSRLLRMAVIQAVGSASSASATIGFGHFVDKFGFIPPLWTILALNIAALLYIIIPGCLLESVNLKTKKQDTVSVRNVVLSVRNLFAENTQMRRNRLLLFLLIYFFTDIVQLSQGAKQMYYIYGLGPPFCWSSVTLGYFQFTFLGSAALGQVIGSKMFSICLGHFWILQIAYIVGIVNYLISALAPTTVIFLVGAVIGGFRAMDGPVIHTIFSTIVTPEEQGVVFAVESSVQSIANFVSPLILNPIYSATVKTRPNLVFYVMGSGFLIIIALSWIWMLYSKKVLRETTKDEERTDKERDLGNSAKYGKTSDDKSRQL